MIFHRKSIFDIVTEAEDDEDTSSSASNDDTENTDTSTNDSNSDDSSDNTDSEENNSDSDDNGDDEDFSIDTDLDDDTSDEDSSDSGDSSDSSSDIDTDSSSSDNPDEEPVKANTDIFSTLTAEEQKIKIAELKKLFGELYTSCNDLLEKINSIDTDDDMIDVLSRMTMTLYSLKNYIGDYITTTFSSKSYIENDVTFNRFLAILNSVSNITNEIVKIRDEKLGKSNNQ